MRLRLRTAVLGLAAGAGLFIAATAVAQVQQVYPAGLDPSGTQHSVPLDKNAHLMVNAGAISGSKYGAVQIGTSATLVGGLSGRKAVSVQNLGPNDIYCGTDSLVTSSTGTKILATSGSYTFNISDKITLYCICSVAQVSPSDSRVIEVQ